MRLASSIFFFYCLILAVFISVSGFITGSNQGQLLFQLIFLPVTFYFLLTAGRSLKRSKVKDKQGPPLGGINLSDRSSTVIFAMVLLLILVLISLYRIYYS
jgi:hypothetical protein